MKALLKISNNDSKFLFKGPEGPSHDIENTHPQPETVQALEGMRDLMARSSNDEHYTGDKPKGLDKKRPNNEEHYTGGGKKIV